MKKKSVKNKDGNNENNNDKKIKKKKKGRLLFRIVDRIGFIRRFVVNGGIKLKWGLLFIVTILTVLLLISTIYFFMVRTALLSANHKLCKTISGNIASAESFLSVERKPLRRSLILQDITANLSKSNIPGLVHAVVYDLRGMLSEKEYSFASHTNASLRGTAIPKHLIDELEKISDNGEIVKIDYKIKQNYEPCYMYRFPFKFFNSRVGIIELVFTEASIFAPIKMARHIIFGVGVFMLVIGIFLARASASTMVKPIRFLIGGVEKVGEGDLELELDVVTHDEIGKLTMAFNEMIVHLREKLQMQKFVSQSTITMIKEKTKDGDIGLGGVRDNLAFLFSDIRGFTAMSEKLKPEIVVSILNKYLDLQAQIIKEHGGDIDKFVGDEVMAEFSGPKKADNCLNAAVDIIKAVDKLNDKRKENGDHIAQVGIGLHIGDVVHGRMGSRDRMDNTSIGDTVNLAARLCSQADPGMILASKEIVSKAAKKKFVGKKLDPIRVKGKSMPVEIFQILDMKE